MGDPTVKFAKIGELRQLMRLGHKDQIYFPVEDGSWLVVASFPFLGATQRLSAVKAVGLLETGTALEVRVYDVSNSLQICLGSTSSSTEAVFDLGVVSNLPSGDAVFELQARVTGSSPKGRVHSVVFVPWLG